MGKFELIKFMKIANLLLILELESFVRTFKEAHGADHAASHMSFPENSGMGNSSIPTQLFPSRPAPVLSGRSSAESLATHPDAILYTSVSSPTPPVIPDFPWRSQPSLTFELTNADLILEEGAGGFYNPTVSR
jgi:hypothetical protein